MKITVCLLNQIDQYFEGVEGITLISGKENLTKLPVAEWEKFGEESGSEMLVNIDTDKISISDITLIDGILYAFGKLKA